MAKLEIGAYYNADFAAPFDENSKRHKPSCPVTRVISANLAMDLFWAPPPNASVARYDTMRVAIEVLRGEFEQLSILQRFHLMHQAARDVHAFAGTEFELFHRL